MKAVDVVLGGRTFQIAIKPRAIARQWRKQFKETLMEALTTLNANTSLELTNTTDLKGVMEQVIPLLVDLVDTVAVLFLAYATEVEAAYLDEHATDDEVIAAFIEVVKLAFPLESVMALLGRMGSTILTNSPAPSGASAAKNSTR